MCKSEEVRLFESGPALSPCWDGDGNLTRCHLAFELLQARFPVLSTGCAYGFTAAVGVLPVFSVSFWDKPRDWRSRLLTSAAPSYDSGCLPGGWRKLGCGFSCSVAPSVRGV